MKLNLLVTFVSSSLMLIISLIVMYLFFIISSKVNWEKNSFFSFECGFTSYFFSRFSFSIHYFLVALTFLFLDLELCIIMPLFNEMAKSFSMFTISTLIVLVLLIGLLVEWSTKKLEWVF